MHVLSSRTLKDFSRRILPANFILLARCSDVFFLIYVLKELIYGLILGHGPGPAACFGNSVCTLCNSVDKGRVRADYPHVA